MNKIELIEIEGKYYIRNLFFIEVVTELPIKYTEKTHRPYVECDLRNIKLTHTFDGTHIITIT